MDKCPIMESENKIKEQLKYIQTNAERKKIPYINTDPLRAGVVNQQLFYRAMAK